MAQLRDTLKEKYRDVVKNRRSVKEREKLKTDCFQYLEKNAVELCFILLPLDDIQKDFLERATKKGNAEFRHLVKVLQLFEKYAASILAKPWCKDFYTIKVYTGFFKYNFEKWISFAAIDQVFNLIGYTKTSDGTLTLEAPVDENRALAIGFELYLAHTQLYIFKSTEYLSSKYAMKDIIQGWFSTTGSPVNVLEWLGKNTLATKEAPGFEERYQASTEVPEQATGFKSFTNESYYDKNGDSVNNLVRYPPECKRGEYNECLYSPPTHDVIQAFHSQKEINSAADGNYSSLATVDIPDSDLYGSGDQETLSPQYSNVRYDDLNPKSSFSMPNKYDEGMYETLEKFTGDKIALYSQWNDTTCQYERNTQTEPTSKKVPFNSNSSIPSAARDGNFENGNSYIHQHATDNFMREKFGPVGIAHVTYEGSSGGKDFAHDSQPEYTRVHQILTQRIESAERKNKNPLASRHSENISLHGDRETTSGDFPENVSDKIPAESNGKDNEKLNRTYLVEKPFTQPSYMTSELNPYVGCFFCSAEVASISCIFCKEDICKDCIDMHKKRPCVTSEHNYSPISHV